MYIKTNINENELPFHTLSLL